LNDKNVAGRDYVAVFFTKLIGVVSLAALLFANIAVLSRFLQRPSPWSDELLKAIFIWIFFIGGALAFRDGSLIGITLLEEKLLNKNGEKAFKTIKFIQTIFVLIFAGFCAVQSGNMMKEQFALNELTSVLQFPSAFITMGFFIGSLLWTRYCVVELFRIAKAPVNAEKSE